MPSLLNTATDHKTAGNRFESTQASRCWCQMLFTMTRTVHVFVRLYNQCRENHTPDKSYPAHLMTSNQYAWLFSTATQPFIQYTGFHGWSYRRGWTVPSPLTPTHTGSHSYLLQYNLLYWLSAGRKDSCKQHWCGGSVCGSQSRGQRPCPGRVHSRRTQVHTVEGWHLHGTRQHNCHHISISFVWFVDRRDICKA